MPLVALLEGQPVLALDPDVMRATCRDPKCGAEVHRRAGQGMVPHWVHNPGTADRCEADHNVGPWHVAWQMTCVDPARIEVIEGRRRADVRSRFGWAIEFQHSNMRGDKLRAREDDWKGALIWVQDATTPAAGTVVVREPDTLLSGFTKIKLDWHSPPSRIGEARCHQIVDIGEGRLIWLTGRPLPRGGKDLLDVDGWLFTHEAFIDTWINGHAIYPPNWSRSRWAFEQDKPHREIKPPKPRSARLITALADAQEGDGYRCEKAKPTTPDTRPCIACEKPNRPRLAALPHGYGLCESHWSEAFAPHGAA